MKLKKIDRIQKQIKKLNKQIIKIKNSKKNK